ncbi:MAG: hypothetical protein RIK87_12640 [Fuerstiella sp.]
MILVVVCGLSAMQQTSAGDNRPLQKESAVRASQKKSESQVSKKNKDARNNPGSRPDVVEDPEYLKYGIYAQIVPCPERAEPATTQLPLKLNKGARIALVGNTLIDRSQLFGYFETMLHQKYPDHQLIIRNLAWPADTPELQPRPDNFADQDQLILSLLCVEAARHVSGRPESLRFVHESDRDCRSRCGRAVSAVSAGCP